MLGEDHEAAEDLAVRAAEAGLRGDLEGARTMYSHAADAELRALERLPVDRPRAYSAIALSAVALLYKSHRYGECELVGYRCLSEASLLPYARREIREIVDESLDALLVSAQGRRYSDQSLDVALSGGKTGFGTADLAAVLNQFGTQLAIARRVAEWDLGLPLRTAGPPPKVVDDLIDARVSQPVGGSYRFTIKLTEPDPALFPDLVSDQQRVDRIAQRTFDIISLSVNGRTKELENLGAPAPYLRALVRLVRGLVPDGHSVEHIQISQPRTDIPSRSVRITHQNRSAVSEVLRQISPPIESGSIEIRGTLRAVDLDQRSVVIATSESAPIKLYSDDIVLDDIVGPMVNRRVIVRALKKPKRSKLLEIDVEE